MAAVSGLALFGAVGVPAAQASPPGPVPSCSGQTCTVTFSYSGADQTFTVPVGVSSVEVDADGAAGGFYAGPGASGPAAGGSTTATVPVTAGDSLTVVVGGAGTSPQRSGQVQGPLAGGFGGGGAGGQAQPGDPGEVAGAGGGGGTFLFDGSSPLVVAGGGGGYNSFFGFPHSQNGNGVGGSGAAGQSGGNGEDGYPGTGGTGATSSGPGIAGNGRRGSAAGNGSGPATSPAALGVGGTGADSDFDASGSGGGGGYYGGGGASGDGGLWYGGGGGGGGYVAPSATNVGGSAGGAPVGDGSLTLTYTLPDTVRIGTSNVLTVGPDDHAPAGTPVTLTTTLNDRAAVGTVTFYDGGSVLGTAYPSSGIATLTTTKLTAGKHDLGSIFTMGTGDSATAGNVTYTITG